MGLDPTPVLEQVRLGPEDRLLLYTDGLVEARAADGRQFEPDERVEACLTAATLDRALDGLVGLLLAHAGGRLNDDLALVLLAPATSPFPRARPPRGRRGWAADPDSAQSCGRGWERRARWTTQA